MNDQTISVAEAKKHFSELIGRVAYGKEQIIITKRGRAMARLIPADHSERSLGDVKGWLDENDPFFDDINSIIRDRKNHMPRVAKGDSEK